MRVHPQQLAQVLYTSVSREPKHATAFFKKFMLFIEQHGLQSFLPEIKRHLALLKEADDRKNRMVITTPYALSAVGVNKILKAFGSVQGV
ncbi:MAG: hypothetical protein LRY44_00505, partial [Candidatus Pacebacteria bacterium]|nr:hypothetical protein [Candidatus Paceibacterota bacterium]